MIEVRNNSNKNLKCNIKSYLMQDEHENGKELDEIFE